MTRNSVRMHVPTHARKTAKCKIRCRTIRLRIRFDKTVADVLVVYTLLVLFEPWKDMIEKKMTRRAIQFALHVPTPSLRRVRQHSCGHPCNRVKLILKRNRQVSAEKSQRMTTIGFDRWNLEGYEIGSSLYQAVTPWNVDRVIMVSGAGILSWIAHPWPTFSR